MPLKIEDLKTFMGGNPRQLDPRAIWGQNLPELDLYALVLVISSVSLSLSVVALIRGAPATLAAKADSAVKIAHEVQDAMQSVRAEVQTYLGAIEDERERTVKAQARGRAQQQRNEQHETKTPHSRNEVLSDLRRQAGLI